LVLYNWKWFVVGNVGNLQNYYCFYLYHCDFFLV